MESLNAIPVRQPLWRVQYDKKDISVQIAPYILSITYTDYLEGQSDELQIYLEDRDGRWRRGWFPGKGDEISAQIGYLDEGKLTDCGVFQIDEIELNGPPDTVSIRCLAAGVVPSLRTTNTKAYEQKTLREIAQEIAAKHGLTIKGTVPEIKVERITQKEERDLAFLKRLAAAYGFVFSVRGQLLVWHDLAALDAAESIVTIDRSKMASYTFRSTSSEVYKACQARYWDPKKKKEVSYTFKANGVTTGDTLKLNERCENRAQAEAKAKAALRNTNGRMIQGDVTIEGNQRLVAGVNVKITGLDILDNTYQVIKSTHSMDRRGGYVTKIELSANSAHVTMRNLSNQKKYVKAAK